MSESQKGWKPGREPWCWQPKFARRLIRQALDATNTVSSGLLVYDDLTEIASDKQSPTFQTTHGYIAGRTGLSQRTVQQRIHDLTEIRVIKYEVAALRGPATYTLLSEQPLPDVKQSSLNAEQPLPDVKQRAKNAPLPSLEESPEESEKNQGKKPPQISYAQQRIEWDKSLNRAVSELKTLGELRDHDKGTQSHNRILELNSEMPRLRKLLGIVV